MDRDGEVLFPIEYCAPIDPKRILLTISSSKDTGDQVRIVIECADHKPLVVQKSLITRHSDYFKACLKHDFQESRNSTIQLLEVDADLMTLYLSFAHRQFNKSKKSPKLGSVGIISTTDFPNVADWPRLINLYQLLDYIQNKELLQIAGRFIQQVISFRHCSMLTPATEGTEVDRFFEAYANAFDTLDPDHPAQAKFGDEMVARFFRRVHCDVLVSHHHALESHPEFVAKISRRQSEYVASRTHQDVEELCGLRKVSGRMKWARREYLRAVLD
ncbi:hypothetical protein BDP81DRAFT_454349 [Colletotrichum phormii]|uniref:BTB domain-containing protein n=1 Tax=Colletotrichum phormii TaxID=359342 RepID=A0AAJ0E946_9PEZI|nr:uncharacterized protein BDP81DRAFT_454349 [Colletotrichum phormii]KAK1623549.1 hypothetical protein BDP81DRAFT_454349 [Colletotrichum phormii]